MNTERRTSMAERRPSIMSHPSYVGSPLIVPHLAGIEDPVPEVTPEKVDVLISGTGMVESVLAAALAWQGSNVLHIDKNNYYGDASATLTVDQIKNWVNEVNNMKAYTDPICYGNAKLYVSNLIGKEAKYQSRDFGIDLSPKFLFAQSDLLSILIKSRVHQYLEFQSLSNFHTYEDDFFEKLTNTKQEIFTDSNLPLMTKRNLMKFIKFVFDWENQPQVWESYTERSITELLIDKFKLELPQVNEIVYSIGLCYGPNSKVPASLQRIRRYLTSYDVYGPFPVLYSKYGGAGELSQGFCRSAAVAGATYKLNVQIESYDPHTNTATLTDGSKVHVSEKVVVSPTQLTSTISNIAPEQKYQVHRLTCIVEKSCEEWFHKGEFGAVVVFPPGSLKSRNEKVVQAFILGSGSESCPQGTAIWYLSTVETGIKAEHDLDAALEAMEKSIIRESSQLDMAENQDIIQTDGNGHTILNSVKLGQSFLEYTQREKIGYLFKFYYTQYTSVPPFEIVDPMYFQYENSRAINSPSVANNNGILSTSLPSAEISYDEVVTAAKVIYEKIVGSDDDFFDVDFEDTDENKATIYNYENAIEDDEDMEMDMDLDKEETAEFVSGEIEI